MLGDKFRYTLQTKRNPRSHSTLSGKSPPPRLSRRNERWNVKSAKREIREKWKEDI